MRYLRKLLRDRRGTATVEAAVMLPVMAITWAGVFFRFQGIESYMDAAVESRRDAWKFADQACEGERPPSLAVNCVDEPNSEWMSTLLAVPVVGYIIGSIWGFEFTATGKRSYNAPPLLGGGKKTVQYPYRLTCNEKDHGEYYILTVTLCEMVGSMGLSMDFAVDCPNKPDRGASCD
jgi:hypothetical protein